jgi:beta-N-acetylhexosaminidase
MSPSALRRQIGQLLIAGFNGQQIPTELRSLAKEFGLGGVILFARNIGEPEQVAELCFDAEIDATGPDRPQQLGNHQLGFAASGGGGHGKGDQTDFRYRK